MRQLRVYKSLDIVYFDFWDTTTSTAIPITNDMADSISASIIHKPPTVDKIAFWHIYGNSQIVSYQFDMITDNLGVPYNTSTAQLALMLSLWRWGYLRAAAVAMLRLPTNC